MRLDDEGDLVPDPLYSVFHPGVVADNVDPEQLSRVRLIVPGIFTKDAPSPWAFPCGTLGGGSAQRGGFFTPEKGADVAVFFMLGNPDRPHYFAGHWGKPDGNSEVPTPVLAVSKTDATQVRAIETPNHLIWFDDRAGSEKIVIRNKSSGKKIMLSDDAATEPFVKGTQWKAGMEAMYDAIVAITVVTAVGTSSVPVNSPDFIAQRAALSAKLSTIIFGG